jgi:hypothetical protein
MVETIKVQAGILYNARAFVWMSQSEEPGLVSLVLSRMGLSGLVEI